MSEDDRQHWDRRYADEPAALVGLPGPPSVFAPFRHLFPNEGVALELACGRGEAAVWLARRGMEVHGVDVSPTAIDHARRLARLTGVAGRCRFEVLDLDYGLPDGPQVDLLLCHKFRDRRLDRAMIDRLVPGGLLAVAVLSEVGGGPGSFRAVPGELRQVFGDLEVLVEDEAEGVAWLLGRGEG